MTVPAELLADLCAALDPARVHREPTEIALYARDASLTRAGGPVAVCFPVDTAEVAACVRVARSHRCAFVARGAGTGLAGGAVPVEGAVVIVLTKMDRIRSIDVARCVAWVEPGVLNLDLNRAVAPHGLRFAPDPSSQQACSIGGNVANNSGGPHCLAEGVTSAHVLAMEVVLPTGEVTVLGGLDPDPAGFDLRGSFVGSEGTLGIATAVAVRLLPLPPCVRTVLATFGDVASAANAVSAVIAEGLVPAALEMLAGPMIGAVEDFVHAGFPREAGAVLLAEVDGMPAATAEAVEVLLRVCGEHGASSVTVATTEEQRALWWKGRKSAFGAVARIAPNYYLHDTVVPRSKLAGVLEQVDAIAAAHGLQVLHVFHAGDGNLHPLLVFDARTPGVLERVHAAGDEIVAVSLAAGGVLSGEHGIGLEKRNHMASMFSPTDLDAQARLRDAFDPDGLANPTKILPAGSRCGDLQQVPPGVWV